MNKHQNTHLKILHTSDWHLGRLLYGQTRYTEFAAFLEWLVDMVENHAVNVLLIAGDIFDSATPTHRAQTLYYECLYRLAASGCRHVVIIGGNHDSPSLLNAPQALLKTLQVHVIGSMTESIDDEIVVLFDVQGQAELMVCAVPYLRDRDIRQVEVGEDISSKAQKLIEGIEQHYALVIEKAEALRQRLNPDLPLIAMGHLFVTGGQTIEDDGVRELYIGSLAQVSATIFPDVVDYVALGHLHVPQIVAGLEHIRYSGSPIAMGFGEATQQKSVCLVEFQLRNATIQLLPVPTFQDLVRIQGDWQTINLDLARLKESEQNIWLEVIYTGEAVLPDLAERLQQAVVGSKLTILRIKNKQYSQQMGLQDSEELLENLSLEGVFERCLEANAVPDEQKIVLRATYQEALSTLYQQDKLAE